MLAGFKPGSSGVGSNCATTTAPVFSYTAPKPSSFQFTSFSLSVFTAKVLFVMFFKHFARYALFIFCSLNCLPFNLISLSLSLSLVSFDSSKFFQSLSISLIRFWFPWNRCHNFAPIFPSDVHIRNLLSGDFMSDISVWDSRLW